MRLNGGVIGASNQPTNRVAPGVWSAEELRTNQLYGRFPRYYEGWDLTYLINTTPVLLSTTTATGVTTGSGIDFKPDGTRMYVLESSTGGELAEFALSTAWDSSTASLSSASADTTVGQGVAIRPDGRAFFACGTLNPSVRMHIMTTPWTASTAVRGNFTSVASQDSQPTGLAFKSDGTKMYIVGTASDTVYQYSLDPAWAVSTATYDNVSFSVTTQDANPTGVTFSSDGSNMYISGDSGNLIYQYSLSTAWNISTASFVRSVAAGDAVPQDVVFKDDGTKMYVVGDSAVAIKEFTLSTAWNISTAGTATEFFVSAQDATPVGIAFKTDGTKMYVVGDDGNDINEYNLSTPWSISTATYSQAFVVDDTIPQAVFFKSDGTRMYVVGQSTDRVYEYYLPTAWSVASASVATNNGLSSDLVPSPNDIRFKPDGTKMYTVSSTSSTVREYNLSGAWDIFTASFVHAYTVSESITENGLEFSSDGLSMYLVDNTTGGVYKYNLSTAWNVSTASFAYRVLFPGMTAPQSIKFKSDDSKMFVTQSSSVFQYSLPVAKELRSPADEGVSFAVGQGETSATSVQLSYDGTNMYVVGNSNDRIYQYALSTPWDLSTASYTQNTSITVYEPVPTGVYFKPDGTNMYITGTTNDNVTQFTLSAAWDISTATFVRGRSVAAQDLTPSDVQFKPDGTKMYIVGSTGDDINEYNLSTPWDISTTTFVQSFVVVSQETTAQSVVFRPDGLRMFVTGSDNDGIYQYDLTTPWNVSTAGFVKKLDIGYLEPSAGGLAFKNDGTKLYIVGTTNRRVYELNLG